MFIDSHAHAYRERPPVYGMSSPEEILARYDEAGIEKGALLPIVNPEIYLPQSNEEILEICRAYPDRFFPFCNIDPRGMTNSPSAPLGDWLRHYRDRGCKGIGEVMPNLPFSDPRCQNLFRHVQDVGFPLIFDISDRIGDHSVKLDDLIENPFLITVDQQIPVLTTHRIDS